MQKRVLKFVIAAAAIVLVNRFAEASSITTTYFSSNVVDQNNAAVTNGESLTGVTDNLQYSGGYIYSGSPYYPYYSYQYYGGNVSASYTGVISATGRPVVGCYAYSNGAGDSTCGYSNARADVAGAGASFVGSASSNSGIVYLYTATTGDTVNLDSEAVGFGGYSTGISNTQAVIVDAPSSNLSGFTPYLTSFGQPISQSDPVQVQIGTTSLTASRSLISVLGSTFASPYEDTIDVVGKLSLNGNSVGTFDDPLDFAAGDSQTTLSLANELTTVNVDFSGIESPTATLLLDYSIVATAYDALGNGTQTTLASGSTNEIVAVPEPATTSLFLIAGAGILLRRRKQWDAPLRSPINSNHVSNPFAK